MQTDLETLEQLAQLSPFEIKDKLITLADATAKSSASAMLNAGRGNPNWIATTPREAYFALGYFALTESKRALDLPGVGGMPPRAGCAGRLYDWCEKNPSMPGAPFLRNLVAFAIKKFSSD